MTKLKVSATVDPAHLAEARALMGTDNVSVVLETALVALIEREHERRWLAAHAEPRRTDPDLPVDIPVSLPDLPWDDE
jgi:post-segregation antitoxin (ccd killing protein)